MASYPEVAGFIVKVVGQVLNIGVTVIIFVLIFKVLPDAKIKVRMFYWSCSDNGIVVDWAMGNILLHRNCECRNYLWCSGIHGCFYYMDLLFCHYCLRRCRVH